MADIKKYLVVAVAIVAIAGCRRFSAPDDTLLARVGDRTLHVSDLKDVFPPGTIPADSAKLLESYVDMWVRSELKVREAEHRFRGDEDDIEAKVRQYRNSLLTYKLDQYYIEKYLDTTITAAQIADYYAVHKADLKLDAPIVKGLIVRLPEGFRNRDKFKKLIAAGTDESRRDWIDISLKNGFLIKEWQTWTDAGAFIALVDVPQKITPEKLFATRAVQEFSTGKGGTLYYVQIYDSRMAGDVMPAELPRTRDMIRTILLSGRRQEVIRSSEDTLMMQGRARKDVTINIGKEQ